MSLGLIIDICAVILLIVCGWNGYRNGIIRGVFGIVAVIVALYGASLVAKMYSNEFTSMFKPFVSGLLDNSMSSVMGNTKTDGIEDVELIVSTNDKTDVYEVSFATLRNIGLSESAADKLAEETAKVVNNVGRDMATYCTKLLCERIAYVCVYLLSFIIIVVILEIIENAIDIVFTLPGLGLVDGIGGVIFGLAKGILIILVVAMFLRYTGLLLKENKVGNSYIITKILNSNPIAKIIGI